MLYPHGGCGNHGCEAIVRSIKGLTGADVMLLSSSPAQDKQYGLDKICDIRKDRQPINKVSLKYWKAALDYYSGRDKGAFDKLAFSPIFVAACQCDAALSVGGDNYCYGTPEYLYLINRVLRASGKRNVLLGCSIIPESLKGELLDDLGGYDCIVARESLSYQALTGKGLRNVYLCPDPAFALPQEQTQLPEGFVPGNTVGINLSPMVCTDDKRGTLVFDNAVQLVSDILSKTDYQVALIPHVVWKRNDDRIVLNDLYKQFGNTGRVIMVGDRPAGELKTIISSCRFLVAARTHACIAGYSSCVPTLALGYSPKALGIAEDVMPDSLSYVIPVQKIVSRDSLSERFYFMVSREKVILEHLNSFIPDYKARLSELKGFLD